MDPLEAVSVFDLAGAAESWATSLQASIGSEKANALQHSYWASLIATAKGKQSEGQAIALYFTTAHEFSNRSNEGLAIDSTMDLHNNLIGSSFFCLMTNPYGNQVVDSVAIRSALLSKLNAGTLWIMELENDFGLVKSNGRKIFHE